MNFALVGCDTALFPLLREIAADESHRLVVATLVPPSFSADLLATVPSVRLETQWEALPHDANIDAVIVAAGVPDVEECVKQIAAAGKPVLFLPDGDPASSLVYELALVGDDTHVPLVPLFLLRATDFLRDLGRELRSGSWGKPLHLQWERSVAVGKNPHGPPVLSPGDVHRALVHDADLLRELGGNYSQVTAVRSGETDQGFSMITVTLAGAGLPTATWTARAVRKDPSFELRITANSGDMTLTAHSRPEQISGQTAVSFEIAGDFPGLDQIRSGSQKSSATTVLDHFSAAVSGEASPPDWSDLIRATEIVEAMKRSLRRRRTIDLHFETTSERSQFKTQMTAIGCGLMTMTLLSFVFLLIAGAIFNVHPMVMEIARVGIFVPLVLFLLLQFLLFLSRPAKTENPDAGKPRTE